MISTYYPYLGVLISHCCPARESKGRLFSCSYWSHSAGMRHGSGSGKRSCTSLESHTSFAQLHEALLIS